MAVRVAYGSRDDVENAVANGVIPHDTIVLTNTPKDPEILFVDKNGQVSVYEQRSRFETMTDAQVWIRKYDCTGHLFMIHNGEDWAPYYVSENNTLKPITGSGEVVNIYDVDRIDGGMFSG